jgi:hypothetical protein
MTCPFRQAKPHSRLVGEPDEGATQRVKTVTRAGHTHRIRTG